jgi:hypothetical protein
MYDSPGMNKNVKLPDINGNYGSLNQNEKRILNPNKNPPRHSLTTNT